jgi:hypothetical protein
MACFAATHFNLGVNGGFASPAAARLISGTDLIVAWAAR